MSQLTNIYSPQGRPAVMPWWIGNQHRKIILIDDHALLTGSHNFLSYRGDYNVRGEEATYLIDEQNISKSRSHTAELLQMGAQYAWQEALRNREERTDVFIRSGLTWFANDQTDFLIHNLNLLIKRSHYSVQTIEGLLRTFLACIEQVSEHQRRTFEIEMISLQSQLEIVRERGGQDTISKLILGLFRRKAN